MSMSSSSSKVPRNNRGTAPHSNPPTVPRLCSDTLGRFSGGGNFGSSPEDPRLPSSLCVVLDAAPRRGLEEAQEAHSGDMSTMQTMSPHALSDTRDREIEGAHLAAVSKSCLPGHGLTSGCHIGVKRTPLGRSTSFCVPLCFLSRAAARRQAILQLRDNTGYAQSIHMNRKAGSWVSDEMSRIGSGS